MPVNAKPKSASKSKNKTPRQNIKRTPTGTLIKDQQKPMYRCVCCGKESTNTDHTFFHNSYSALFRANYGVFHLCRQCVMEYYDAIKAELPNEKDAIRLLCQTFDVYYSDKIAEQAINSSANTLSTYFGKIGLKPNDGKTYLNNIIEEQEQFIFEKQEIENTKIEELQAIIDDLNNKIEVLQKEKEETLEEEQSIEEIDPKIIQFWGKGYTYQEYQKLEDEYSSWSVIAGAGNEIDKRTSAYVIQACKILIDIDRARNSRDYTAISSLTKLYAATLKECGLNSELDDNGIQNNGLGVLIQNWEKTQPVPEDENENVIRKYIRTWFVGALSHSYGLKNEFTDEYEEELSKYTVSPPDDDSAIDNLIPELGGDS